MSKKKSRAWVRQHISDPFVKKSKSDRLRSRSSYKLAELIDRLGLLERGMAVVDLGAAPGGWSQVAARAVGPEGYVLASDVIDFDRIDGVKVILGDFNEQSVFNSLIAASGGSVDVVMSDMSPNLTGVKEIDQPQSLHLADQALYFSRRVLRPGGTLIVKIFQGSGFDEFVLNLRRVFNAVKIKKPKASRSRSREMYAVATGFVDHGR
ncbi:MAG: 23S rRNA methyltransferase [Porticoccaceae bacterium]|nr:23S rRNA methyltransferase [Porticoccaceae bacterium]MAA55793.1 23S rRNA methyltransferase [Porticoccaceae bacterium]